MKMKLKDLLKYVFRAQKLLVHVDDTDEYVRRSGTRVDDIEGLYLYPDEMLEKDEYSEYLNLYVVYDSIHPLNSLEVLSIHLTKYEDQFEFEGE